MNKNTNNKVVDYIKITTYYKSVTTIHITIYNAIDGETCNETYNSTRIVVEDVIWMATDLLNSDAMLFFIEL